MVETSGNACCGGTVSEMRMGADPAVLQAMVKSSDTTSAQLKNRNKAIKKCKFCIDETIQSC